MGSALHGVRPPADERSCRSEQRRKGDRLPFASELLRLSLWRAQERPHGSRDRWRTLRQAGRRRRARERQFKPSLKYVRSLPWLPTGWPKKAAKPATGEGGASMTSRSPFAPAGTDRMVLGHGTDEKSDEEVFRARGAPEKTAQGATTMRWSLRAWPTPSARGTPRRCGFDAAFRQSVPGKTGGIPEARLAERRWVEENRAVGLLGGWSGVGRSGTGT